MDLASNPAAVVVWGGFALAFAFGAIANQANFCTMGAVSDFVNMGHWGRMRMWLLAIAVAILGAAALSQAGLVDLGRSVYQRPSLNWLSLVVGGAVFGIVAWKTRSCLYGFVVHWFMTFFVIVVAAGWI